MSKFAEEDFNISEYERKRRDKHKRFMVSLIVVAIAALAGMVVFWH